jgi:hypothetical protein
MVCHTKSNARSRPATESIGEAADGMTSVSCDDASANWRPIMLCGSTTVHDAAASRAIPAAVPVMKRGNLRIDFMIGSEGVKSIPA